MSAYIHEHRNVPSVSCFDKPNHRTHVRICVMCSTIHMRVCVKYRNNGLLLLCHCVSYLRSCSAVKTCSLLIGSHTLFFRTEIVVAVVCFVFYRVVYMCSCLNYAKYTKQAQINSVTLYVCRWITLPKTDFYTANKGSFI